MHLHDPAPALPPDAPALNPTEPDDAPTEAPDDALHFAGATQAGVAGLTLARAADAHGPVTGAEQVLRLAQAEPLIRAVEQWLSSAWDPSPVTPPEASGVYEAVVRDPALAPPGTRLWVPLRALQAPPPHALRAPALAWGTHAATLVLGAVPPRALAPLQPGSLLWLPAAFGADWAVQLVDPAGRLPPCAAQLDLPAQRLIVSAGGAAHAPRVSGPEPEPADAPCVQLRQPVQLPLDHWLGWGAAGAPFHWPVPQPWAAELRAHGAPLARGALLPVGAGCGFWVESLADAAVCNA